MQLCIYSRMMSLSRSMAARTETYIDQKHIRYREENSCVNIKKVLKRNKKALRSTVIKEKNDVENFNIFFG